VTAQVSVVMPTYDQDAFLPTAVASLLGQSYQDWECVVVDDGSPGDTAAALAGALSDPRVRLETLPHNVGLGAALNCGLALTAGAYVSYLPSDDLWHRQHLATLVAALDQAPAAAFAVAGVRYSHGLTPAQAPGRIPGEPLQLVQVLHRRTPDRWLDRSQLTTDDLDRMLWDRLTEHGEVVHTGTVSCEWGRHPRQRHLTLREPAGGLNVYRARYRVQEPLRLQSTVGSLHDEVEHYRSYRDRPATPRAPDGLRVLLVGELAHNPERILALSERGHELHGLWTPEPIWFNTVGPVPFGHVRDVPPDRWRETVRELKPDVIYALLNYQAVPVAHQVLTAGLGVPFVWHFKEGPFFAREQGYWPKLAELQLRSDAQIYSSPELRDWFAAVLPATAHGRRWVLDGDLPKAESLVGERSPLLSERDGQVHTVIPGRPIGPAPAFVAELAARGVHLHLYGAKAAAQMRDWVEQVRRLAPGHLHLHEQVSAADWVGEFSQYDAGWLHDVRSSNHGDLAAATWDDLNYPARIATLAAAGVPMIQFDNQGSVVATQTLCRDKDLGVFYRTAGELADTLRDRKRMAVLRRSVWQQRAHFTFDAHADALIGFFREVIAGKG